MPLISTRVGDISYSINGAGSPIVLLHAALHSLHDFDSIIQQLSLHYQTIAVDWPWHGDSSHPLDHQPTAPVFADVLEDVVESLELAPAVFIGNSVGGFAAARLAITHPQKVKGIVLVNSGGFIPWDWTSRFFTRLLGVQWLNRWVLPSLVWRYMLPQNAEDELIATQVSAIARTTEGSKIAASIWRSFLMPEHDLRSQAKEINVPTLLVWGKRDPIIPLSAGYATHEMIKGSRIEVLDTGHVVFSSSPKEFLRLVEPFIAESFKAKSNEQSN